MKTHLNHHPTNRKIYQKMGLKHLLSRILSAPPSSPFFITTLSCFFSRLVQPLPLHPKSQNRLILSKTSPKLLIFPSPNSKKASSNQTKASLCQIWQTLCQTDNLPLETNQWI
jgi:hypothetical protein